MQAIRPIGGAQDAVVELPVLIGSGQRQVLVCAAIPLPSPALEVKEIRKTVIIDSCTVIPGKVIIDGRLRKDINFKTLATGTAPPRPGTFTACSGIVNTASGAVNHTTVDIAFNTFIPVAGAMPGDKCRVAQAVVEGESEEAAGVTAAGTFTSIVDKTVLLLCVTVTRPEAVQVSVTPTTPACPPATTAGVPQGGGATVTFPATTTPGPKPGTAIGPTVSFPGPILVNDP